MKWRTLIASKIPFGQMGETMHLLRDNNGTLAIAAPMVLTVVEPSGTVRMDAAFIEAGLDRAIQGRNEIDDFLQAMMDAAWDRGLRPAGFEGPQELAATKRHLDDMRMLAGVKAKSGGD